MKRFIEEAMGTRTYLQLLVVFTGLAALSWQVVWQIKSSLALGVSAQGTAITLAATMGGMSAGALLMGAFMARRPFIRPFLVYALLEIVIGVAGIFLDDAFRHVEQLDIYFYRILPEAGALFHLSAIVAVLGIPSMCMGATLPLFGVIARMIQTPLSNLYGLNTLGAAGGAMVAAFFLIPEFGIHGGAVAISAIRV